MDILTLIFGLLFVVSLMLGLAWIAHKAGLTGGGNLMIGGQNRHMQMLERLALDPKHRLVLTRVGKKYYLLLTGPTSTQIVDKDVSLESLPLDFNVKAEDDDSHEDQPER